jgi:surface protein
MKKMRQRLFSMLGYGRMLTRAGRVATALLAVAMLTMSAQTAKASLYAKVSDTDNTKMTLVNDVSGTTPSEAGYTFYKYNDVANWNIDFRDAITSITVDESCKTYSYLYGTGYLFGNFSNLTTITDLSNLNTANVTDMWHMFDGCSSLSSLDLSGLNTEKVTRMREMFRNCSGLTSLDVSGLNTAAVTNMYGMFIGCSRLTSLDVSGLNTAAVTNMYGMFYGCSSLTSLDVSNFNTAKVTNMNSMFRGCSGLTTLDLSNFNTAAVTEMSYMFLSCSELTTIKVGTGWSTDALTSNYYGTSMFEGCTKLKGGNGTVCDGTNNINKEYARVDYPAESQPGYLTRLGLYGTMSGTDMTVSYGNAPTAAAYYLEGSGFGSTYKTATSVTVDASCASYNPMTLEYLFNGFTAATSITGLNNLNTANVTNMIGTFRDCQAVTLLDLSAWDTRNVTTSNNMTLMFKRCYELKTIIVGANWIKPYSSDMFTDSKKIVGGYGATTATNPAAYIDSDNADTSETGYLTGLTRTLTAGGPDGEGKYWATFFNSAVGYSISGGEAFAGVYNSSTKKVELTSLGTNIPANTPVVICATSGTVDMTLDNTIAAYAGTNNLVGIDVKTATPDNSYCLAISAGVAGFYKYTSTDGANIPARRAYLTIATGAPSFIGFGDDETTGLKAIDNGQLTIDNYYNLNGQRIVNPTKGLYIVNGKKVVIK